MDLHRLERTSDGSFVYDGPIGQIVLAPTQSDRAKPEEFAYSIRKSGIDYGIFFLEKNLENGGPEETDEERLARETERDTKIKKNSSDIVQLRSFHEPHTFFRRQFRTCSWRNWLVFSKFPKIKSDMN